MNKGDMVAPDALYHQLSHVDEAGSRAGEVEPAPGVEAQTIDPRWRADPIVILEQRRHDGVFHQAVKYVAQRIVAAASVGLRLHRV